MIEASPSSDSSLESPSPSATTSGKPLPWLATTALFLGLTLAGLAVLAAVRFGSIRSAIGYARGQYIVADHATKSFGVASVSDWPSVTYTITNQTPGAVRLAGCNTVCTCTVPDKLPLSLSPGESKDLTIRYRPSNRSLVHVPAIVYTTCPEQPQLPLWVDGEIK